MQDELRENVRKISYNLAVQAYNSPQDELVECAKEFEDALMQLITERDAEREAAIRNQLEPITQGLLQANRYDTDDKLVLHVWDSQGNSFDVEAIKRKEEV